MPTTTKPEDVREDEVRDDATEDTAAEEEDQQDAGADDSILNLAEIDGEEEEDADGGDDAGEDEGDDDAGGDDAAGKEEARHLGRIRNLLPTDKADPSLLSKVNERTIERMPPEARATLRAVLAEAEAERAALEAARKAFEKEKDEQARKLEQQKAAFVRSRAQLMETFTSPAVRELIAKGEKIDESKLDLLTEEGQRAFLTKKAAELWKEQQAPVTQAAEELSRKERYLALKEQYPELKSEAFRKQVLARQEESINGGQGKLPLEVAVRLVSLENQAAEAEAQRKAAAARRRRKQRESASQVRRGGHSAADGSLTILDRVQKIQSEGYRSAGRTYKGSEALALYFQKNPKARDQYLQAMRRR